MSKVCENLNPKAVDCLTDLLAELEYCNTFVKQNSVSQKCHSILTANKFIRQSMALECFCIGTYSMSPSVFGR